MKYAVVIERGPSSFGASVPDLPGCVAVGATRDEVAAVIEEAIEEHIAVLRDQGMAVPAPSAELLRVDIG